MKVQLIVKNLNKAAAAGTSMEAIVGPADTVLSFLDRVSEVTNTLCFPDQKLRFNGKDLAGNLRMASCGIQDGDVVELVFQASDDTLVKQLSDLLEDKALTTEELGLLYLYRHLVPVDDALKAIGHADGKLQHFLANQKHFSIDGCLVKVAKVPQPSTSPCSTRKLKVQVLLEVSVDVEVHVPGKAPERLSCDDDDDDLDRLRLDAYETVAKAKEIIASFEQMPFPDRDLMLGDKKLGDNLSLHDAGVCNGAHLVLVTHASANSLASQLEDLLKERVGLSLNELSLHYCQRFGTPISKALRTLGLPSSLSLFLESQSQFFISGGCVTLANGPKLATPPSSEEKSQDKTHIEFTKKAEKCPRNAAGPVCFQ